MLAGFRSLWTMFCLWAASRGLGDLCGLLKGILQLQWALVQPVLESLPPDVLHGDEGLLSFFPHLVNMADIGVIESSRQFCFPQETLPSGWIFLHFLGHELEGDLSAQGAAVLGQINLAHPALTELFEDLVMGDSLADQYGPPGCREDSVAILGL